MLIVGELGATISGDTKGFDSALDQVRSAGAKAAQKIGADFKKLGSTFTSTGKKMTMGLTAPILAFQGKSLQLFNKQAQAIAQVEQGIRSTGGAAGFTLKQFENMASEMQGMTLFGDEEILQGATAQLLTFTNIANDEFERTQQAALDLATRLDGDLKSASIQLGKALNDPVSNLSALSRSGIQFDKEQKTLIKSLWETGQQAEAQRVILAELEKQYGGSAEAAAKAGTGGITQLKNEFRDLLEDIGALIYEGMQPMVERLRDAIKWARGLSKETLSLGIKIAGFAAMAGSALIGVGLAASAIGTAIAALTSPITLAIAAIGGLAAAGVYLSDNWDAVKERMSDWSWWRNMLVDMTQFLIEYSPISLMIKQVNSMLRFMNMAEIPNMFEGLADSLEGLKGETKEYETEFGSFKDSVLNAFREITGVDFSDLFHISRGKEAEESVQRMRDSVIDNLTELDAFINDFDPMVGIDTTPIKELKDGTDELSQSQMFLTGIANDFTSSFGQGMSNLIVQGEKFKDVLENIGKLLLSSAIQAAISAFLTGGLGGTGFFGKSGGLFGSIFGTTVNDALIKSDGSVVKFHPDDNLLAMKDFSSLLGTNQVPQPVVNMPFPASQPKQDMEGAFDRVFSKYLQQLGPEDIFALGKKGGYSY